MAKRNSRVKSAQPAQRGITQEVTMNTDQASTLCPDCVSGYHAPCGKAVGDIFQTNIEAIMKARGITELPRDEVVSEPTKISFTEHIGGKPIAGTPAPLPCPFCGDPRMMSVSDGQPGDTFQVICEKCGAWGPPGHTQVEAALAWNRRLAHHPAPAIAMDDDTYDTYGQKNEVLRQIDKARGVIEMVSLSLQAEHGHGMVTHAWCALDLVNEELQRTREAYAEIVGII